MRKLLAAAIAIVVAIYSVAASGQSVQYSVIDLGTFGGTSTMSDGLAINNQGQVVGYATNQTNGNTVANAFFYAGNGAALQNLGTLDGQPTSVSQAVAINNNGWVTGYSDYNSATAAFLWTGSGTIQNIGNLGGSFTEAYGINDSGVVVGSSETAGGAYDGFKYSNGVMINSGSLQNLAINDSGQIAAFYYGGNNVRQGYFISAGGQAQNIGSLGGTNVQPAAINSSGEIVGFSSTTGNQTTHGFLYSDGAMTDLGVLPGAVYSNASGINDYGDVVGESGFANGVNHAILYTETGGMEDLNNLISPSSDWTLEAAYGINDNDQIVGIGISPDGDEHTFLLNPTPEPSSFALLAIAAVTIVTFGYRRARNAGYDPAVFESVRSACGAALTAASEVWSGMLIAEARACGRISIPAGRMALAPLTIMIGFCAAEANAQNVQYTVIDLGTFGGASLQSDAMAINNQGQVVGYATDPTTGSVANAFYYSGSGTLQNLGTLDGQPTSTSSAVAINNNGWVTGYSSSGNSTLAFVWTGSGSIQPLPTLGGALTDATGINDVGTIVGQAETASGAYHGFKYSNGVMTDTGTLINLAINNSGQIAAVYSNLQSGNTENAYLVEPNGGTQSIGSLGGTETQPAAINNSGQVVGFSDR